PLLSPGEVFRKPGERPRDPERRGAGPGGRRGRAAARRKGAHRHRALRAELMMRRRGALLALLLVETLIAPSRALANPRGAVVRSGSANVTGQGTGVVDVHQQTPTTVISWEKFDIDAGEVTNFHQPGQSSIAINRILDSQASRIFGALNANGHVYLINPNGML